MDGHGVTSNDLQVLCAYLAHDYPFAARLNSQARQAAADRAWAAISRFYENWQDEPLRQEGVSALPARLPLGRVQANGVAARFRWEASHPYRWLRDWAGAAHRVARSGDVSARADQACTAAAPSRWVLCPVRSSGGAARQPCLHRFGAWNRRGHRGVCHGLGGGRRRQPTVHPSGRSATQALSATPVPAQPVPQEREEAENQSRRAAAGAPQQIPQIPQIPRRSTESATDAGSDPCPLAHSASRRTGEGRSSG